MKSGFTCHFDTTEDKGRMEAELIVLLCHICCLIDVCFVVIIGHIFTKYFHSQTRTGLFPYL